MWTGDERGRAERVWVAKERMEMLGTKFDDDGTRHTVRYVRRRSHRVAGRTGVDRS